MPNALINTMSNGVSNNFNRYPMNVYSNNYQGYRSVGFPVQSSAPQTNVIWINDVTEVYTYPITNDSQLLFGDQKNNTFYYRIVDKAGSLLQVTKLPFTVEVIFPAQNNPPAQTNQTIQKEPVEKSESSISFDKQYVTKEEHEQLFGMVKSVSEKLDKLLE